MKVFIAICRMIVGSLFIASGLIKVNDVIGFSYKLEEYFSLKALGFPELIPYVIPIAIFIVVGEVLVGVATLLGAWPKLTSSLLLFMTLFFAWLTYYTWTCDPISLDIFMGEDGKLFIDNPECVQTCGCFGDAIKLTPKESFFKDIFLLPFVLPFFFMAWRNKVKLNTYKEDLWIGGVSVLLVAGFCFAMLNWMFPIAFTIIAMAVGMLAKKVSKEKQWVMALAVLAVCAFTQYWTLKHLPLKDYRPYAIGQNLIENMKTAEELGLEPPKFLTYYTMTNRAGETKEVDSEVYIAQKVWQDTTWSIVKDKTYSKKVKDGYEPKIMDFTAMDMDGNELKDSLFAEDKVFLCIMWNLEEACEHDIAGIKEFADKAQADGIPFYGMTTAGYDEFETFRHDHQLAFPFLQGDEKVLKTMMRANPGVIYMEKATVKNMWSGCDVPNYEKSKAENFQP